MARRSWSHRALSTMSDERSARRVSSSPRGWPSQMRAPISASRRSPIRHGIVLPQASSAQKRVRAAARSTTQLLLVDDHDGAGADVGAGLARASPGRRRRPAPSAGRMPPDGPPTSSALSGAAPGRRRPRPGSRQIVTPSGTSAMPGVATAPEIWTRMVPRLAVAPVSAKRPGPAGQDGRHGRERLRAVDQRRLAEQAAGRGVGRLLLGLAALALETLEQDRLLAEHVGALQRLDRDMDLVPDAEDVGAEVAGRSSAAATADSQDADRVRRPRPGRRPRPRSRRRRRRRWPRPRERRRGCVSSRIAVRQHGRVRLIGVDDDVAAIGLGSRRRRATSRRSGCRRRRGRAGRTSTMAAITPSALELLDGRPQAGEGAGLDGARPGRRDGPLEAPGAAVAASAAGVARILTAVMQRLPPARSPRPRAAARAGVEARLRLSVERDERRGRAGDVGRKLLQGDAARRRPAPSSVPSAAAETPGDSARAGHQAGRAAADGHGVAGLLEAEVAVVGGGAVDAARTGAPETWLTRLSAATGR